MSSSRELLGQLRAGRYSANRLSTCTPFKKEPYASRLDYLIAKPDNLVPTATSPAIKKPLADHLKAEIDLAKERRAVQNPSTVGLKVEPALQPALFPHNSFYNTIMRLTHKVPSNNQDHFEE